MIGQPLIVLDSVASTNNYIAEHPDLDQMAEGTAIMAESQTAGRGQGQNTWQMSDGRDLAVSYFLRPNIGAAQLFTLNKALTLGLRRGLEQLINRKVTIKWPNDLMVGESKLGGILIEVLWQGLRPKHLILGVGVNVGARPFELPKGATSISGLGLTHDVMSVFDELSLCLDEEYQHLAMMKENVIRRRFDVQLWRANEPVTLQSDQVTQRGRLLGVDSLGRLMLQRADGGVQAYPHGEWRLLRD